MAAAVLQEENDRKETRFAAHGRGSSPGGVDQLYAVQGAQPYTIETGTMDDVSRAGGSMSLYVLRLRDGNCIVVDAPSEEKARERARPLAACEVVTARKLDSFVAQFSLTDGGELAATLLDKNTLADLHQHEYPLLNAAHAQSYMDFDASETDSRIDEVRFNAEARAHARDWDQRDKQIVRYAVEQERLRFAN